MSRTVTTVRTQTQAGSPGGGMGKDHAYSVELAKSGRSKCSACREAIPVAVPRFVSHVDGPEGTMHFNSHVACVPAWKWRNARKIYRELENLPGYSALSERDQEAVAMAAAEALGPEEAEKAAKAAAKQAEREAAKAVKEAAKQAERELKAAAKEAAKEAEKEAKRLAKEAEKAQKAAAKEAEKAAKAAESAAKKGAGAKRKAPAETEPDVIDLSY